MKDLTSRISRQGLTQCAALLISAAILSSCTSKSSVTTVSASGQGSLSGNFNLTSVCPNSAGCLSPSLFNANLAALVATNGLVAPNTTGFIPASSFEFKGTCDLTVASLQVAVTYNFVTTSTQSFTCDLAGNADFVLNLTNGDGPYSIIVTPLNLSGAAAGGAASSISLYSKASFNNPAVLTFNSLTLGTGTFAINGLNTLAVGISGANLHINLPNGVSSTTLTIVGNYDNTEAVVGAGYVNSLKETKSGTSLVIDSPIAGKFTETFTLHSGASPSFDIVETDLATNSANIAFKIVTGDYMVPEVPAGGDIILAGGSLPTQNANLSGGASGHYMSAFTIMPMLNIGLASSSGGDKLYTGTPAITSQGP